MKPYLLATLAAAVVPAWAQQDTQTVVVTGNPLRSAELATPSEAAADASDRRLMVRGSSPSHAHQSEGDDAQEGYIAFQASSPAVEPTEVMPTAGPQAHAKTKGYALYSVSSSLPYSATSKPHSSRYRKAPTSAAVDAMMAPVARPTMGLH